MRHRFAFVCSVLFACNPTSSAPAEAPTVDAPPVAVAADVAPALEPPAASADVAPGDAGEGADPSSPDAWAKVLPKGAGPASVDAIGNLDRLPGLTDLHRARLASGGFFVTPQASPNADPGTPAEARTARRAKHLFQVYERNDYIRFPNYVTVDLAIDLTHQYFDVVLRQIEGEHLTPRLRSALQGLTLEATALYEAAERPATKQAALAAASYWATALRLLEVPAPGDAPEAAMPRPPWHDDPEAVADMGAGPVSTAPRPTPTELAPAVAARVAPVVAAILAASGRHEFAAWGQDMDLSLTRPRSHYNASGVLQRYFRAMSFLGLTSFPIRGSRARPEVLAMLCRSGMGNAEAAMAMQGVLRVIGFIAGKSPTADLKRAAKAWTAAVPGVAAMTPDQALARESIKAATEAWSAFEPHPLEVSVGPVVQPAGQRVLADTQAMAGLRDVIAEVEGVPERFVARSMGALGAAAVMGHAPAAALVQASAEAPWAPQVEEALLLGGRAFAHAKLDNDAYHGTLSALRGLFAAEPVFTDPEAYHRRMLMTFAGGWAMLRHDTLLYAYQMGAECDADELPAPYSWVEPHPEVYRGLATMVGTFRKALSEAGIGADGAHRSEDPDAPYNSIAQKTEAVVSFLEKMEGWARAELAGKSFSADERTELAMVGGFVEHVMLTLADSWELGDGNDDMALVADVFTWGNRALEVGVAHPDLIYAVIPTPEGWQLARGAVLSYREFFVPRSKRMTDEVWREQLAGSPDAKASARPDWLESISAPPIGVVTLRPDQDPQTRCGYYGGNFEI